LHRHIHSGEGWVEINHQLVPSHTYTQAADTFIKSVTAAKSPATGGRVAFAFCVFISTVPTRFRKTDLTKADFKQSFIIKSGYCIDSNFETMSNTALINH